ncbi:MAG: hypothetical protein J5I93_15585 [Pirellulaceae bacterium]|nr:hypothetical protein [Pirellulaceae bacterium]
MPFYQPDLARIVKTCHAGQREIDGIEGERARPRNRVIARYALRDLGKRGSAGER